jgi:hypothetical protein
MPHFKVMMARLVEADVFVEAPDEAEARRLAKEELPEMSANDTGYWSNGVFSADASEWMAVDEMLVPAHDEEIAGPAVQQLADDDEVGPWK